ncbi:hypothetical protein BDF19DRAFT_315836 [Syncephalis fuscata]|nr:hypothetical protein BDF19DRAFT_315836 [Syncephalis fuscata]
MSVWSIDVPDQTPLPAAPPPGVPPVPRLTTELVSMPTVTPANEPTLTPMSSSRAPTTTPVHSANNKLATSSTASTLPELNLDHDNPSTEWVPQPTFAAAVANAMASLTADEAATLAQASAIATNSKGNASQPAPNNIINDMLQRLAESNPELLNEGYTGSIFDLWADDNTQEENEEDLDEVNELDQDDKAVIAEMMQQHAATSANQDYKPASTATPNPVSLLNRSNTLAVSNRIV